MENILLFDFFEEIFILTSTRSLDYNITVLRCVKLVSWLVVNLVWSGLALASFLGPQQDNLDKDWCLLSGYCWSTDVSLPLGAGLIFSKLDFLYSERLPGLGLIPGRCTTYVTDSRIRARLSLLVKVRGDNITREPNCKTVLDEVIW